ncbi:MAG: serine/threonine protein kinase [Anaerolineae bacterium]|nr:serine/threonine protein kinase [Anaerolineae bacterium]
MDDFTSAFPIINNRYQIHKTLASGGMAVIYLARDLLLERKVALKILRKDFSDDQQFQNSFRAEAKASARLSHPNIVTTYDFGYDADRLYIVLELVEGTDLKSILAAGSPLETEQAFNYLLQAGKGLGYAHQAGIVHCDVKPQNMLVSNSGILKITDFGIARALDSISRDERYDVVWGSPYYISPEQARGMPPSPATDIYSLGVIAYEMLAGRPPFDADDSVELARMHREDQPLPLRNLRADLPREVEAFIQQAMSKEPADRFADGNAFVEALQTARKNAIFPKRPLSPANPDRRRIQSAQQPQRKPVDSPKKSTSQPFNWLTILLSFLALILGGGLIPFWIYVILSINK